MRKARADWALMKIGLRVKIDGLMNDGKVLYHWYVGKTKREESAAKKEEWGGEIEGGKESDIGIERVDEDYGKVKFKGRKIENKIKVKMWRNVGIIIWEKMKIVRRERTDGLISNRGKTGFEWMFVN